MNNIAIGENALKNATNAKDCFCLGRNAGFDIIDSKYHVRIGNFTKEEVKNKQFDDCLIINPNKGDKLIVIKRDVLRFLEVSDKFLLNNGVKI